MRNLASILYIILIIILIRRCDHNKYTLEYVTNLGKIKAEKQLKEEKMEDESLSGSDVDQVADNFAADSDIEIELDDL